MAGRDAGDADRGALDPALTQKKRARRRLLGALALGIAAVIVLPLVLDSEPRQAITDVQVEIPPRDAAVPAKDEESTARPAEVAVVPPVEPMAPEKDAAAPDEAPKPSAVEPKPEAVPKSQPAPKVQAAPKTEVAPKPQAAAKTEAAPAPASAPKSAAHFAVQLGAFANAGSARAQADKARKAGVRVYTETVKTAQGERTRVRVGPFASREDAEQARTRLKSIGVESAVVPL
ncbi:MAG: SPOR domain-containing protein [Burkholderiaceae bacterium]|nr:SPOR domain-containing protein [Burkholderiaceae bacterium]